MITLRGDLTAAELKKAATAVTGVAFPAVNHVESVGEAGLCWMSPDELLLLCPYAEAAATVQRLQQALAGTHHLVANVSDARALITVSGTGDAAAREVIGKLSPADVSPAAFAPGQFRRSRIAQVPAAFWMPDRTTFHVICFRSVARYVFDALAMSAHPGSAVDFH
jgi:sarcosine oxidase subunit gamma